MRLFRLPEQNSYLILLVFAAVAALIAIADRAPIHLENSQRELQLSSGLELYVDQVVHHTIVGPFAYRVLMPYTVDAIARLLPVFNRVTVDFTLKIALLFLCQVSFFSYMRTFFSLFESITGVLWLDLLLGFSLSSIQGPSVIETADVFNLAIFIMSLIAIHGDSPAVLVSLLFIGTLNRETTWFILPIVILNDAVEKKGTYRSLIACAAISVPYFGLRLVIPSSSTDWFITEGVVRNIPFLSKEYTNAALSANAHVLILLAPLVLLALRRFNDHPLFLRVAASITPLFIIVHYIVGWVIEARLWMPLFALLLPLAIDTLRTPRAVGTNPL